MTSIGTLGGTLQYPREFVADGWAYFKSLSDDVVDKALYSATQLAQFGVFIPPINTTVEFQPIPIGDGYVRPPRPTAPAIHAQFPTAPAFPGVSVPSPPVIGPAPTAPDLSGADAIAPPTNAPGDFLVPAPERPDVDFDVAIPAPPDYALPPVPALSELQLPTAPTLNMPELVALPPSFDTEAPEAHLVFDEQPYSSALLDSVRAKVMELMQGVGLPADVEQQLYDRARTREEDTLRRSLQEVDEDFDARGFDLPDGVLHRRRDAVRQQHQHRLGELNRDVYISNKQLMIENMKFAVSSGIALEQVLINLHNSVQQRRFEMARTAVELAIQLYNAKVTQFQAEVQAFEAQVRHFEAKLRGELAKLEAFRAEIEAQLAIAEVDKAKVALFEAQLRGVLARVEIYKGELDGARSQVLLVSEQLNGYRADVEAFKTRVDAYAAQWRGYGASVEAYGNRLRSFQIAAEVYGERVRAYSAQANVAIETNRSLIQAEELKVRGYTAQLDAVRAQITAEAARINALTSVHGAEATMYRADADVARAESDVRDRQTSLGIEQERARTAILVQNAQLALTRLVQTAQLQLEALRGASAVYTQLGASVLSGVNFNASYSGALADSFGRSVSWNYSGNTPTSAGPT